MWDPLRWAQERKRAPCTIHTSFVVVRQSRRLVERLTAWRVNQLCDSKVQRLDLAARSHEDVGEMINVPYTAEWFLYRGGMWA